MPRPAQPNQARPNEATYWVDEALLAGEYPIKDISTAQDRLTAYLDGSRITSFIDLTYEGERPAYHHLLGSQAQALGVGVDYQRLPIDDFGIPSPSRMTEILDAIDAVVEQGGRVYVHCRGGIGRTGTLVGCYLRRRHGYAAEEALAEVHRLFQASSKSQESYSSPETAAQRQFVREWNESK